MKENIEAIYQLSPTQEGMLFHALFEPESGLYFLQFTCTLRGSLDREAFRGAWQKVYDRHAALRTIFHGEGLEKPVQVVLRRVELIWEEIDWRGVPPAEQESRWQEMLRTGRESGLDLSRPPLTRLILVRTAEDSWLFAWFVPHLLIDGWCLPLLLREVFAFYAGLCRGEEVRFERSRPYRDYIGWLLRQDLGEAESFWRRLLAGFEVPTPLPIDRMGPRPEGSSEGYGYVEKGVTLSAAATARLAAMARRYQLTANTLVQGAWALLLSRYSGERDVVFGSTVSGRSAPLPGIEGMIGLFINTLPARTEIDGESLLLPWLRRLQAQQAEMRQYEYTPLVQVQGWSEVPRGVPLFESILVFENYPVDPATERGVQDALPLAIHEVKTFAKTNYALTVLARMGERMTLHVKHEIGRFDASTAERLLGHLEQLLVAMAENPVQRLRALSPLRPAERHQLLVECNDTAVESRPVGRTLHELFEARAAQSPESVAVVDGSVELTYAELERQANRLAWHLLAMGVGPGCSVAVYLDRRWEMIPTLLGILKTGAAYVPLEIAYPKARVQWILSALDVPCVISQRSQAGLLEEIRPELRSLRQVVLAEDWAGLANLPGDAPTPAAGPADLAYTIFTSGSTGTPKGVQVLHRAAVHLVEWINETFGVGPADRVLFVTSLCFDLSVYDVFGLLAAGGSIRIASTPEMRDPIRLVRALFQEPITFWDSAPAFLQQLVPLFEAEPAPEETALRRVFLSGDWIPVALPDQVRSVFRQARMIALGGATEATVWSNWFPIEEVPPHWVSIPYGRPMWNARYHVLDDRLEPCPIGVPGDLYIAGECLASGYAGEPVLTAGKFIPSPYASEPGGRMYRTGDRARHRLDGSLEFLGRLDHQVKIRGFRIELGEVEAALEQHLAVRSAVALAREDEPGRKRLVAYYTLSGEAPAPAAEEMRRFASERLPEYMVPSAFVVLEAFPVTANGKLDRRALPAPGQVQKARQIATEPRTETERTLARIWSEVLRVERLGIDDNFFELGGDSILSIQIVSRAGREGISILPRHLFEHPTIAGLAATAAMAGKGGGSAAAEEAQEGAVPLTPSQSWLFEQELADLHHFNQALLLEVAERIDPVLFKGALTRAAEHHDAFRLRFHRLQDGWEQRYAEEGAGSELLACDLSGLPAERRGEALRESATRIQAGFDPGRGPLLRTALFRMAESEPERLLLVAHHLVVDAVSWRIFLEDLETCYRDLERGATPSLPRTTSFGEWARALAAHARSESVRKELSWWLAGGGTARPLPVDRPGGRNSFDSLAHVSVSLSAEETRALLQEVPEVYRTRIDEVLLTALAQAVAEWTGSRQVLFEMERHGREDILPGLDLTRTVGWFTAFVPLRLEVALDSPSAALLSVKEQVRSMPGRGLGYGLLRYLGEESDVEALRALPEAEISFNYLGQLDQALPATSPFRAARESSGEGRSRRQQRRHLLDVSAFVAGGVLNTTFSYSRNLHEPATAERLAQRFLDRLSGLIEHCRTEVLGAFTPADFPEARLDPEALDRLMRQVGSSLGVGQVGPLSRVIESVAGLSPAQEGMLFHSLYAPDSGVYCIQMSCRLAGDLDAIAFRGAWERVIRRHSILRSGFFWEGFPSPVQVAFRQVALPWQEEDWRGLPPDESERRLEDLRVGDRLRGFDPARAPLLRLTLVRLEEDLHAFIWTCHHLLVDGWSLSLVLQEIFLSYKALRDGEEPRPEPVRSFRDYIAWLQRQDLAAAEALWRRELRGLAAPAPLDLGSSGEPSQPRQESEGESGRIRRRLPDPLARGIQALARQHRLTLYTLVQGAWALLLARYTSRDDVVFGGAVSGRPADLPGVESIVGPFLNTLPVRARVEPGARLLPWLADLQQRQVEMRQHEFTPLVQIKSWSGLDAESPLFDTLLVFESYPTDESLGKASDRLQILDVSGREQTNYPWTLLVDGGSLELEALFDTQRFRPADVRRLLGSLETLLGSFARHPQQRLADVDLMSEAERVQILHAWNDTAAPVPGLCLHELFERQASRAPEALALIAGGEALTYAELDRRAERLARHLRRLGVGPEVVVGLCSERSPDMVVGLLAVLKAGGAYLPLDPKHPAERLSWMLESSGAHLLLVGDEAPAALRASGVPQVRLSEAPPEDEPDGALSRAVPENLCYVIYTSGSTGRPKGVQVLHRAAVSFLSSMAERPGIGADDVLVAVTTLSFDISVLELFLPLSRGARVVLADAATATDGMALRRLLDDTEATMLQATPATWRMLIESGWRGNPGLTMLCGGEALPRDLADLLLAGGGRLWNLYGPTETTVWSTVAEVRPDERAIPIGRPIANTRVYLLGPDLRPVPVGVAGELYIAGVGLARSYRGRPDLTAERLLPDPFVGAGERMYRVGDLARWRPDGDLHFLGRSDFQVKIRGFRIELGEIEAVLARHPAVRQAVAAAVPDTAGGQRLAAWAVPGEGPVPALAELRAWLAEELPEYMLPSRLVWLEALPLTSNGKIDRKALPLPDAAGEGRSLGPVEGLTPIEELLATIWSDVLGAPVPAPGDSFFDLGGHSLLATRLVSRLRDAFGVELSLRRIFEVPVLRDLAREIGTLRAGAGEVEVPPLVPMPRDRELPLSFPQQRLWFLDQLEPGSSAYNMPFAIHLSGDLDADALAGALDGVARRHEVLRTLFPARNGQPVQIILPEGEARVPLVRIDLSDLPAGERETAARSLAREEAGRPFDLARGPLMRAALLDLGGGERILLATLHHIVCDGWSLGLLTREVAELYRAFAAGEEPVLPPLAVQYADFAAWQRRWLRGEVLERQLAYWRDRLADLPAFDLPADLPPPEVQDHRGADVSAALAGEVSAALRSLARREGCTLNMALLAALQTLLYRLTGQEDIVLGMVTANRDRAEIEPLIGVFINTLPLRVDLSGRPTFRELLRREREAALGAFEHRHLPFDRLVEELQPERDLRRHPIFDVLFNNLEIAGESLDLPGLSLQPLAPQSPQARFALTLYASGGAPAGDIRFHLVYQQAHFSPGWAACLLAQLARLLEQAAATPDLPVSAWSLVTEEARAILPDPSLPLAEPLQAPVPALVDRWAEEMPWQTAVCQDGRSWPYADLRAASARIASLLLKSGLRRGETVAVRGERSFGLIASMLGVLRAGGVLLSLDPAQPASRQALLAREAGACRLLRVEAEAGLLPEGLEGIEALMVDPREPAAGFPEAFPDLPAGGDPAYIFFTSGTTGVPKGVLGCHKGLSHFLSWQRETFGAGPGDRIGQLTALSFDVVLRDIFLPLISGAALHLPPAGLAAASEEAVLWLDREGVTLLHTVPALAQTWLAAPPPGAKLAGLRCVFFAGEPLNGSLVRKWRETFPGSGEIVNLYGPTETTLARCFHRVPDPPEPGVQPVGRPLPESQALVLREGGILCGFGEPGEIVLRTPFRSLGYINPSPEDRARFVLNPHRQDESDLLYFTGDRGKYGLDGALQILGRGDSQIKIRGVRVEPEEVAAVLLRHAAIKAAVVVPWQAAEGSAYLAAYVVAPDVDILPVSELRAYLAERLPGPMVPSVFVKLDRLPLNPNGKVDRRALPEARPGDFRSSELVPPRDTLELLLVQIWERVLDVRPIGVTDDFFELGGHSLQAVRLRAEMVSRLGVEVPLAALFQGATVERLAALVRQGDGHRPAGPLVPIQPRGSRPPLFCVHPGGGSVLCYQDLARALGNDQPVYGLQARGLEPGEEPNERIEDLAAEYLRAVREVQAEGPYFLAGWSFGGIVAFEIARQIAASGQEVAFLGLLDSRLGGMEEEDGAEADRWLAEPGELAAADRLEEKLARAVEEGRRQGLLPPGYGLEEARRLARLVATHQRARRSYRPDVLPVRITLFQADEIGEAVAARVRREWRELTSEGLEVETVPGDHYSLLTPPHVVELARRLGARLDPALRDGSLVTSSMEIP